MIIIHYLSLTFPNIIAHTVSRLCGVESVQVCECVSLAYHVYGVSITAQLLLT